MSEYSFPDKYTFDELSSLLKASRKGIKDTPERIAWRNYYSNFKAVYLITVHDQQNNIDLKYIGSAYGQKGLRGRWTQYINGVDGNCAHYPKKLRQLKGKVYQVNDLNFEILEMFPMDTPNDEVITRENSWKEKLNTRDINAGGLNGN